MTASAKAADKATQWRWLPLEDCCTFHNGLWTGKKPPFETATVIRNTNFTADGTIDLSDVAVLEVEAKQLAKRSLQKGDIIIEKSGGGPKQPVGRVVLFDIGDGVYSFSNFTSAIRVKDQSQLDPRYLHRVLYWWYVDGRTEPLQRRSTGIRNLDFGAYQRLEVPLPPLEEQKRIVAVLDQAFAAIDRARALAEANLADAEALEANASDQIWRSLSANAEVSELGKLAQFRNGLNYSRHSGGQEVKIAGVGDFGSRFWLPTETLKSVQIDGALSDDDLLAEGDILAVRSNGNKDLIGRVMLVGPISEVTSFSGFVIRIRPTDKRIEQSYLCHFMKSSQAITHLRAGGGGANISNLNQKVLDSLCVPVPSHRVQAEIVQQLGDLNTVCSQLRQSIACKIADLADLRQSLLQKAFAGELT